MPDCKPISRLELPALANVHPPDKPVALALETTGLDPRKDSIISTACCFQPEEPYWFRLRDDADREALLDFLSNRPLILYDAACCCAFLKRLGMEPYILGDPKLMVYSLNPVEPLDLRTVARKYVGIDFGNSSSEPIEAGIIQYSAKDFPFDVVDAAELMAIIACATLQLHDKLRGQLGWAAKIYRQELELAPICAGMRLKGISVSLPVLQDRILEMEIGGSGLKSRLDGMDTTYLPKDSNKKINWLSNQDIGRVLTTLGVPLTSRTPGGKLSVKEDVLERLKDMHPIIPLLLELRHTVKLAGMCRTLKKSINEQTEAIHCEWIQTGVPTGRFRSKNPNLQQIPDALRSIFTARSGHYFLNLDYDQLEYRILAACARESELVEAFRGGGDVHRKTASLMLGIPMDEITPEQRKIGKVLGYSQLYGSGASGLAHKLNIPTKKARELLAKYFAAVPKLVTFLDHLKQTAMAKGYVESYFGRRRPLPEIYSNHPKVQAFGMRSAVNGFAQSTAADVAKQAMLKLAEILPHYDASILLQLHDGFLLKVPEWVKPDDILPAIRNAIEYEIEGLPLTVSVSWGWDWKQLYGIESFPSHISSGKVPGFRYIKAG